MAEILGAANSATKFFLEVNQISIDNWTFKLFYKATTSILLVCSVVSSSKQFFGDPINCEASGGGVNDAVLQSYCWMYSTFNIPLEFRGSCSKREHDGTTLYNSYYQWVSLFLVVCAVLFYAPRAIWLMAEGGLMKFLSKGTTTKIVEDADKKRQELVRTFQEHLHNKYNMYAFYFFCCEQLNFLVVVCMWFITNKFLKYHFLGYGPNVIQYYQMPPEERNMYMTNPMCEAFPRIAACNYVRYGSGGGQENKSAICILGLNMINDKVFLILWFWYFFLTIFACLRFVYRIVQLSSNTMRYHIMRVRIHRYFKTNTNMRHVEHYAKHCSIGDWFVLYQMSRNMNTRFFAEFLTVLSVKVNPCPGLDDEDCAALLGSDNPANLKTNGLLKCSSTLSLHDRVVDLGYDPIGSGGDENDKPKSASAAAAKTPGAPGEDNSSDEDDEDRDLLKKRRGVGSDADLDKSGDDDEEDTFKKRRERLAEERAAKLSTSAAPSPSRSGGGGGGHGGMRRPHQYRV